MMTKIAIVVGANLMFLVFSIPVVTIGPALAALYYVMLETLYRNSALNPFKTFWKGFKMNFKQGIVTWLIFLAIAVLAYFDIRYSNWAGGMFKVFLIGIYVILVAAVIVYTYLYPVMASFNGTVKDHYTNAIYFAFKKPLKMILLVAVEIGAAALTYGFLDMLPLWAFCWFFFGFGAIAMLGAKLLLPLFKPFQEPNPEPVQDVHADTITTVSGKKIPVTGTEKKEEAGQKAADVSKEIAAAEQKAADVHRETREAAQKTAGTGHRTDESDMPEHFAENEENLRFRLSDDDLDSMDDLKKLDGV